MDFHDFVVRGGRALRSPRRLAARILESGRRRAQRPWSAVVPRLVTERTLLRATGAADVDVLWQQLAARPFFLRPGDRDPWTRAFAAAYPGGHAEIVADADRVMRHEFDLLGSGPIALGESLPWRTDFKTAREWPLQYCADIHYDELDRPTDVKVPWELSRCQHVARLGQAYWLTGDDRYAREFVAQVSDWTESNPYAWSVNWACTMDVALRAVSWIWGFYFFADAPACRAPRFRALLLRSLWLHGEFIATHLERADLNGNHYLCDGVGLVFLGCLFGATRKGRRWRDIGREIVVPEILSQVTADGVDFEQSTAYQRLVLEAFATSYLLLERHGDRVPPDAWARLARMLDYVEAYTKPDGRAPLIGDADDGRIQILGTQPIGDHRYLLSSGAVIFDRADLKARAARFWEESFWLFGPAGLDRFERLPDEPAAIQSKAFPAGGVFVLRNRTAHLVIDCGEVGMRGRGGHGHNDILSFELFLNGFNVITDCGAYLYTASREWRNRFRSTAFHNTVQVDGEELNRFISPDELWQLRYDAIPTEATLRTGACVDRFRGGHRGYERLASPVTHSRECILDGRAPRVLIRDRLDGAGTHQAVWRFHLDPAVTPEVDGPNVRLTSGGRSVWLLPDARAAAFAFSRQPGWVSPRYGVKTATTVLVWEARAPLPLLASFLFAEAPVAVEEWLGDAVPGLV